MPEEKARISLSQGRGGAVGWLAMVQHGGLLSVMVVLQLTLALWSLHVWLCFSCCAVRPTALFPCCKADGMHTQPMSQKHQQCCRCQPLDAD